MVIAAKKEDDKCLSVTISICLLHLANRIFNKHSTKKNHEALPTFIERLIYGEKPKSNFFLKVQLSHEYSFAEPEK